MSDKNKSCILGFCVAGINYRKADMQSRGSFAIDEAQYKILINNGPAYKVASLFVLSTCNRTEIYGMADDPAQLVSLLCSQTKGNYEDFMALCYVKTGLDAIEHLFQVAAGLDSQILGDYEIVGQIKQAVNFARVNGSLNCFLDRLVNNALQCSKAIKNNSALSDGSISVSYAAVQYIKQNIKAYRDSKILLIGIGKIGFNTCKNLVDYLGVSDITLINRTEEKAKDLAAKFNLKTAAVSQLYDHISSSDIIIVATSASKPFILCEHVTGYKNKLIIDLSVPNNVEPAIRNIESVNLINVDELSKLQNDTLQARRAEIPKAKAIIRKNIGTFLEWHRMRENVSLLNELKQKLKAIHPSLATNSNYKDAIEEGLVIEKKIQAVLNRMAGKMRTHDKIGCRYLEALNEFMMAS